MTQQEAFDHVASPCTCRGTPFPTPMAADGGPPCTPCMVRWHVWDTTKDGGCLSRVAPTSRPVSMFLRPSGETLFCPCVPCKAAMEKTGLVRQFSPPHRVMGMGA